MMRIQATTMLFLQPFHSLYAFQAFKPKLVFSATNSIRRRSLSTIRMSSSISSNTVPRAAVSALVRHSLQQKSPKYVLVQRGKEPNKGFWSLPGGKIELGEGSLPAAKRELWEETGLSAEHTSGWDLEWCEDGPICTTDSIHFDVGNGNDAVQFHYVISQWFVEITKESAASESQDIPLLFAADDAADAKWFDLIQIQEGVERGDITPGVEKVVIRSELMFEKGLL